MFFPALSGNLHFPLEKDGPTKVGVFAPGIPLQQEPKEEELELPDPKWAPIKTTVLRGESREKRSGQEPNDTTYIKVFLKHAKHYCPLFINTFVHSKIIKAAIGMTNTNSEFVLRSERDTLVLPLYLQNLPSLAGKDALSILVVLSCLKYSLLLKVLSRHRTYFSDHFATYINIKSLHCTPEINVMLHVCQLHFNFFKKRNTIDEFIQGGARG